MLIYKIYKYFFPQVCSGRCFLIRFANTVFFFFLNHISKSCVTMRNLCLSTCLKTEQVCLCVLLWSAMKSAVVFRGGDVPVNTELLVPPMFFRESHPHPLFWLIACVCVCVGRHVRVLVSDVGIYVYMQRKTNMRHKRLKLQVEAALEKFPPFPIGLLSWI